MIVGAAALLIPHVIPAKAGISHPAVALPIPHVIPAKAGISHPAVALFLPLLDVDGQPQLNPVLADGARDVLREAAALRP